ncbi:MAG: preprotein translocase subunit SecE [Bdellovibrionaceae bacterium]|nr:preprotein translocase subunit SecE [Pseudobdellovibrionaceae bacterium]
MKTIYKKIITISVLSFSILVGLVVSILLELLSAVSGFVARLYEQNWFSHGFPIIAAFLVFLFLQFHTKSQTLLKEAVQEAGKVVWSGKQAIIAMTVVCCIMLLISGVFLGIFDVLASSTLKYFIN